MYSAVLKKLHIIGLLGSISRGRKSNADEVLHFCVWFLSFVSLFHFLECFLSLLFPFFPYYVFLGSGGVGECGCGCLGVTES